MSRLLEQLLLMKFQLPHGYSALELPANAAGLVDSHHAIQFQASRESGTKFANGKIPHVYGSSFQLEGSFLQWGYGHHILPMCENFGAQRNEHSAAFERLSGASRPAAHPPSGNTGGAAQR